MGTGCSAFPCHHWVCHLPVSPPCIQLCSPSPSHRQHNAGGLRNCLLGHTAPMLPPALLALRIRPQILHTASSQALHHLQTGHHTSLIADHPLLHLLFPAALNTRKSHLSPGFYILCALPYVPLPSSFPHRRSVQLTFSQKSLGS